ncbi:unnamed protein product [Parnassius apollo]|uniref:(apollo) hypothetical protein n=2 Tax=Parnassius apollo TaxID=110799 RepID=A0A8S3XMU2_PARAO|nr:unnamed protein product [Parnassius apollo]
MNSSQSSDIFLESSINYGDNPTVVNDESYKHLLARTKEFLVTESIIKETTFFLQFSSSLDDCYNCITQCLDTIGVFLADAEIKVQMLCIYLEDAISLLQKLSCFVKNITESIAMSCSNLKTFSTTMAHIILTVFIHCKDSESLYGTHLNKVEKQLKDLFRTCHELQLTYLMILEKHFIFDMTEKEQQNVLLEALDINLKIGEIVQALDVKTMAEQWKAYTAICEKYSNNLLDKNIYNKSSELLCAMIENNITSALEKDEQDKIVLRSLKVASFTIKILVKVTNIFSHGVTNNYEHAFQLLVYIYSCDGSILEGLLNKSQQFISQVDMLIFGPTKTLLSQLLTDERFVRCISQQDLKNIEEDKQPGYIFLLISAIKFILQFIQDQFSAVAKREIIGCIFSIVPYSHVWFNIGLKIRNNEEEAMGLEEYFLTHMLALCMTLSSEEMSVVEHHMLEAVLGNQCCSALFSSSLWVLLASVSSRQYLMGTVSLLCKIYQKLEGNASFHNYPQKIHLGHTINRLLEILPNEDRVLFIEQFNIQDKRCYSLWSVLKIKNLPANERIALEETVLEKLLLNLNKLYTGNINDEKDMEELIKIMKLSSTCSFMELNSAIEENLVKAWIKVCPKHLFPMPTNIGPETRCYFEYVDALNSLTTGVIDQFYCFENVLQVFHVMTNLILIGNCEISLILIPTFCKISLSPFVDDYDMSVHSIINGTLKYLLLETAPIIKHYTFSELVKYRHQKQFNTFVMKIIIEFPALQEEWHQMLNTNYSNLIERKKRLILYTDCSFIHKCVENKIELEASIKKTKSQTNFELDIDTLFDSESDSEEPPSKKTKLDSSEIEATIKRLEYDSLLLSRIEDISKVYRKRIKVVYERLGNIIL